LQSAHARTVYVYVCCANDETGKHTITVKSLFTGTVHSKTVNLGKLADKQDWDDVFTSFHLKTGNVGFKACVDGGHCKKTSGSDNEVHLHL